MQAPVDAHDVPREVLCRIPFPVIEALAEKQWVAWRAACQFEIEHCKLFSTVPVNAPIPLPLP